MDNILSAPLSHRQRNAVSYFSLPPSMITQGPITMGMMERPHESHPDFLHLTLLVFEAVLEVVFVALPGYIIARMGMFDVEAQKLVANLNIYIFTPCLSMRGSWTGRQLTDCPQYLQNWAPSSMLRNYTNWPSFRSFSSLKPLSHGSVPTWCRRRFALESDQQILSPQWL